MGNSTKPTPVKAGKNPKNAEAQAKAEAKKKLKDDAKVEAAEEKRIEEEEEAARIQKEEDDKLAKQDEDDKDIIKAADGWPTVDHKPAKCPNCGSIRNKVTTTRKPAASAIKRYHKCENCKQTFASLQEIPLVDQSDEDGQ